MIRRLLVGAAVALGASCAGPAAALAHPLLLQAAPSPGLVAPQPPAAVSLDFTEPAVPAGSRIAVIGPHGRRIPTGRIASSDGGRTLSVQPSARLRPAVYRVRWTALGDDGHTVSGQFSFGVAGPHGAPPPGAGRLGGAAASGRGGESASGESVFGVVARWLGILAASLLFGGFALLGALRRRGIAGAAEPLRALAPLAWLVAAVAASEGVIAAATAGAGGRFQLGLVTASATGRVELARAIVAVVASLALAASHPALRDRIRAAGAGALLLTYALAGHVLAEPSVAALLVQSVHVLAAALWLGGLTALVLLTRGPRAEVALGEGARAFAPLAGGALGLAVLTGVLAAVRDVDHWYFLRWSDYGRVVIAKAALVALVGLAGGAAWLRGRRGRKPWRRLVRAELLGALAVLALASSLAGLAQGRGRPLPAERGTLLPGPAFATALLPSDSAHVALAPARPGANVVSVTFPLEQRAPRSVAIRLACACSPRTAVVPLRRGGGGTWSARADLPSSGAWYAYLGVDGRRAAPVQLPVGVPSAPGAPLVQVLSVADLSGADADVCRSHELGLELAIGRINAAGGLDGGRKVAPLVLDDGGSAARAAELTRTAIGRDRPIALAAPCGDGGAGAVRMASATGLPSIVGDPSVDPTRGAQAFRLAADPYAQGVALAQYAAQQIARTSGSAVRTVTAIVGRDLQGRRLLAGLRRGITGSGLRLDVEPPGSLARRGAALLDRRRTLALVLDGPSGGGADAAAFARLGRSDPQVPPAPVLASERVLSERLVEASGALGREGVLLGVSEVSTATRDALAYASAVPVLYPGERPSLDGLRGYVTGLALRDAVRHGTSRAAVASALRHPDVFSSALLAPWSAQAPGTGSPAVLVLAAQFLTTTLTPPSQGGESFDGAFFPDGTWITATTTPLGEPLAQPPPPL